MTTPSRIWRRRTKGWRMPPNTVYVGRPTKWGNPFEAYRCRCCGSWDVRDDNGVTYLVDHAQARRLGPPVPQALAVSHAVRLFRKDFEWGSSITVEEVRAELAGKNLACWCPTGFDYAGAPWSCHADVLLEIANEDAP